MGSWGINRENWSRWGVLERCTYIGGILAIPSFLIGLIGLAIGIWSFEMSTSTNMTVTSLDTKINDSRSSLIHVVPDDVIFDIDKHSDDRTSKWVATIQIQARKTPILLVKKAELVSFQLDGQYFSTPEVQFEKRVELTNVELDTISLENIGDIAEMKLKFEPASIYVSPHQLVWRRENLRDKKAGVIVAKVYYVFDGQEISETVNMTIRFE
ncbi:hypothetical protein [Grimontia sp. SpTr1]|uniref:hypothetical protein n=1 Tax=Grimontia sp. SpTr1 TaxID=2995319 RepID=UPI00248AF630|nr:hypothetical protein [Grimontia sp. SpTr1]